MPGTENADGLASEARTIPSEDIRYTVGNYKLRLALADCRQAVGASWVRRRPGSRHVDHGVGA